VDATNAVRVPNMDVVIQGDRIMERGKHGTVPVPSGARVLDLPDRCVIPGLIDTHAHVTVPRWHRDENGVLRGEYDRGVSEKVLRALLEHGITTVRNPAAPLAEGVALRDTVVRGELVGRRIITAGDALSNGRMSAAEIRAEVRRQAAIGADLIKLYTSLTPELTAAAIDEAHVHGIKVVGHLQRTTWTDAARLGIDAITHGVPWAPEYLQLHRRAEYQQSLIGRLDWLEWVDLEGPEITEMIGVLAEHRIPVDPTLIAYHTKFFGDDPLYTEHPQQRVVPELADDWWSVGSSTADRTAADYARAKRLWPKIEELVRRYHEAGILLTAGSDLPVPWVIPGVSLHEELEILVQAGIPTIEVLRIATRNGAEVLGLPDEIGSVDPGKQADLLVLTADPVADIRNTRKIEMVIHSGRVLRQQ
jgi:imidazolonepropionase-like amidohydrolase